ncbi:MAG: NAD(P)H-dependent oxidoreductase subunit E [Candidatus Diapherotrites archaeon]|nr:NAD(P)H-dependent oxidoreductase subunit E [Candidatus Diapherotrites archaeon]
MENKKKALLLNELGKAQKREGRLSKKELAKIAKKVCMPENEVFSTATFYSFLTLEKRAKHSILLCNCPAEYLRSSDKISKYLEKKLKVKLGQTTKDKKIYLGMTSCIGLCDKAPALLVDGKPVVNVTTKKIDELLRSLK